MKKGKIMMAVCSILAIICIVYGIFVRAAGSGTEFFMVWILGGICLLIVGTLLRKVCCRDFHVYGASCLEVCWQQA